MLNSMTDKSDLPPGSEVLSENELNRTRTIAIPFSWPADGAYELAIDKKSDSGWERTQLLPNVLTTPEILRLPPVAEIVAENLRHRARIKYLANEVERLQHCWDNASAEVGRLENGGIPLSKTPEILAAIAEAVKAEREACAKIARGYEVSAAESGDDEAARTARDIAEAIDDRSNEPKGNDDE